MKYVGIDIGTTTISIVVTDDEEHIPEKKYTLANGSSRWGCSQRGSGSRTNVAGGIFDG